MNERIREGVTPSVNAAMNAVDADVLCEDGLLLRQCQHGVRHPVGHIHRGDISQHDAETRHCVAIPGSPFSERTDCCAEKCCERWLLDQVARVVNG